MQEIIQLQLVLVEHNLARKLQLLEVIQLLYV